MGQLFDIWFRWEPSLTKQRSKQTMRIWWCEAELNVWYWFHVSSRTFPELCRKQPRLSMLRGLRTNGMFFSGGISGAASFFFSQVSICGHTFAEYTPQKASCRILAVQYFRPDRSGQFLRAQWGITRTPNDSFPCKRGWWMLLVIQIRP